MCSVHCAVSTVCQLSTKPKCLPAKWLLSTGRTLAGPSGGGERRPRNLPHRNPSPKLCWRRCSDGNTEVYPLPHSQSPTNEGQRGIPVSWKSGGHGETPGGDTEKAPVELGPTGSPLDVSRLRSSSMEIREKGSEFLKEELHKAQKVGEGTPGEGWCVDAPGGWVAPHVLVQAPVINHIFLVQTPVPGPFTGHLLSGLPHTAALLAAPIDAAKTPQGQAARGSAES